MEIVHLTQTNQEVVVKHVASLIARGGVIAVPTDTVYGLVADCLRESAVKKIFRIKKRSFQKALGVFVRDIDMARRYAHAEPRLTSLLEDLWPGQTTVVLDKRDTMPDIVTGDLLTVGLRVPDYPFLQSLLAVCEHPLAQTSANLSGSEPAQSSSEVQTTFAKHIPAPDLLVDAGRLPSSPASTVLDLTRPSNPKILRMGAITKEKLDQLFKHWQPQQ